MPDFQVTMEEWPLARPFITAREQIASLPLVYLTITHEGKTGRAEAAGVDYRGETAESIALGICEYLGCRTDLPARQDLLVDLAAGGARNAIDCALWDLEAKISGKSVCRLARLTGLRSLATVYTLSLDEPTLMAEAARTAPDGSILKLKLGGHDEHDLLRVAAVRAAFPLRRLIVDVNEGWDIGRLNTFARDLEELGVEMIEQPLPAGGDEALADYSGAIPLCADESANTVSDLTRLGHYALVNVKLDKTGGLTAALELADAAQRTGKKLMVGSMLGTSLGMAPAFLIGQCCEYVDLDGPLLLARDRIPPMIFDGAIVHAPHPDLWG